MKIFIITLLFGLKQVHANSYGINAILNGLFNERLTGSDNRYNAGVRSSSNDPSIFGLGNNNIFTTHIDDISTIIINRNYSSETHTNLTLAREQLSYSQNASSHKLLITVSDTTNLKFYYNYSDSTSSIPLTGLWKDVQNNIYRGSLKLKPYSGIVLISFIDLTKTAAACSATGTVLQEQWDNVSGSDIADIPLQAKPSSTSQLTAFEGPLNTSDNYCSRIRGYICPPQTGTYTFWIATDDAGELWLSTDDNPANKVRIANVDGWTNYREFGKYSSQKSAAITLEVGKKYYIEALQKEAYGGDNLSVQWQLPDGSMETPIAGSHLSPYIDIIATTIATIAKGSGSISRDEWDNVEGANIADIPLTAKPSLTGTITSFEGPLNIADNYGSRIRGYVFPPQTGSYTFSLATDDAGELWLSTDSNTTNKVKIASVDGWTNYREWGKYPSQQSATITLKAGQKYYIEALQKESGGGDNLSVQWQLPDGTMETPIAGIHLSPYVEDESKIPPSNFSSKVNSPFAFNEEGSSLEVPKKNGLFIYPNPVSKQTTVEFTLPDSGQTDIVLFDTKGRFVSKLFIGTTKANSTQRFEMSAESLKDGVYIINLSSGKNSFSKKVIIQK